MNPVSETNRLLKEFSISGLVHDPEASFFQLKGNHLISGIPVPGDTGMPPDVFQQRKSPLNTTSMILFIFNPPVRTGIFRTCCRKKIL
jgi:hypothetical protein